MAGDDLQPIAVWIIDEIDAHGIVFKADTAHFAVLGQRFFIIIDFKSQMELIVPQLIRLLAVTQPGQLQKMLGKTIAQINDDKAPILWLDA